MPSATKVPKNWPPNVFFLTRPIYGKSMRPTELQLTGAESNDLLVIKQPEVPSVRVQIKAISQPTHPAHRQSGLFAAQHLAPDSFIDFYLGFVHGPADTDPFSDYDLSLDRELQIGVDASKMGNEARFINDYRGIRMDGPNAQFRDCLADLGGGVLERRIGVFVFSAGKKGGKRAKGIGKGEEIVVSYGKGFWSHRRTVGEGHLESTFQLTESYAEGGRTPR